MKRNVKEIFRPVLSVVMLGTDSSGDSAANRITIFTNAMALLGIALSVMVYTQLEQFGFPQHYGYFFYPHIIFAAMILAFNKLRWSVAARSLGLFLLLACAWVAACLFGKTFNGYYMIFPAAIYSIVAFTKFPLKFRLFFLFLPYASLFAIDYLTHTATIPVTGLNSANFDVSLLWVDTVLTMTMIVFMVWIEKSLADKYEYKLEKALETIHNEKQKLSVIFDNVEMGILITDSELKVEREHSKHLNEIFEKDDLVGTGLFDLLLDHSNLPADQKASVRTVIINSIGEDELNWIINKDHLPDKIDLRVGGNIKHLSMNWSPVIHQDKVQRVVVSLKDNTEEIKAKEKEAFQKIIQEKIQIILGSLMKVGLRQTRVFLKNSHQFYNELTEKMILEDPDYCFHQLHTFKGEARLAGFHEISTHIHNVEMTLKTKKNIKANIESLQEQSKLLILAEKTLFQDELDESTTKWSLLTYVQSLTDRMQDQLSELNNHEVGQIQVTDAVLNWPDHLVKNVENILLHSFQNSLDHGYLRPNKNEPVQLNVKTWFKNDTYHIQIKDRGAGIDLKKLEGIYDSLDDNEKSLYKTPYDILFKSGFSSAEEVSMTSGQGVGLGAVQANVTSQNGTINLVNREDGPGTIMTITLPCNQPLSKVS